MNVSGIHVIIFNSIFDYAEKKWGKSAKATLLKLSGINIEELEALQNYLENEYFYVILEIITKDFNEKNIIFEIGKATAKDIVKNSVYIHPILSQGNPLAFLKQATLVLNTFFPGLNLEITSSKKPNSFFLKIQEYKHEELLAFLTGFLTEIISNFSKTGRLKIKYKNNLNNFYYYTLKYYNPLRKLEDLIFNFVIFSLICILFTILYILKTPLPYLFSITFLSYFLFIYPINFFISKKKARYYQNLVKELNLHEKRFLELDQTYSIEISKLKASISQIVELGKSFLLEKDVNSLIDKLCYDAMLLTGAEGAFFFLYNKEKHQFILKKENKEINFSADEAVIGKIVKIKKPLVINDPTSSPYFNRELDSILEITTKNLLACPLLDSNNELIAVLEVYNKIEKSFFTEMDITLLVSVCNYGSLALQNYSSIEKHIENEHNRIMSKISNYFSSESFLKLINDQKTPNFDGKEKIIEKLKFFLFIFSNKNLVKIPIENYNKIENFLMKDKNIRIIFLSEKTKNTINKNLVYNLLMILVENSKKISQERNLSFKAEIYFTDEVIIPIDIRKKFRLTIPMTEWNNRNEKLGENFTDYLKRTYPILDEDLMYIENNVQYRQKVIYKDYCGGISEDIERMIFYPFFSTSDKHFGLGLNYFKKLIQIGNGSFSFTNKKGIGVEFYMLFDYIK